MTGEWTSTIVQNIDRTKHMPTYDRLLIKEVYLLKELRKFCTINFFSEGFCLVGSTIFLQS